LELIVPDCGCVVLVELIVMQEDILINKGTMKPFPRGVLFFRVPVNMFRIDSVGFWGSLSAHGRPSGHKDMSSPMMHLRP
jgi:hypothetical protein